MSPKEVGEGEFCSVWVEGGEGGVGVGVAAARVARAFAALEGEWVAVLHACCSAEVGGVAVSRGEDVVSREEMALRAGPDAVDEFDLMLAVEVAVAVTGEVALAAGDGEGSGDAFARVFGFADVGLVVAETLVLGPELASCLDGHSGLDGHVDHDLIETLGVHVDLDGAAGGGDGFEEGLPEGVAALGDAALAVDAEGEAGDLRAGFEDGGEGVAAVGGVGFGREAEDVVVGVGTVGPLVGVGPDAELEVEAAASGFGGDVLEGFEIALALAGLERWVYTDGFVVGDVDEIGVGEVKVVAGNSAGKVVAEAESEIEAVEAGKGEGVQVGGPEGAVVEPGLVFGFGEEGTGYAADFVGGGLDDGRGRC